MACSFQRGRIRSMRTIAAQIKAPANEGFPDVLTPQALEFLAGLHTEVEPTRRALLEKRAEMAEKLRNGGSFQFLAGTAETRNSAWRVAEVPQDLRVRKVEITGPTDRKMVINALNSGASVYMADFEDANTPTWHNMVDGQRNLIDAVERKISFKNPDGREYKLNEEIATLVVRPRGWHLVERHLTIEGAPISGAIFARGGMAAYIRIRRDPAATGTALAKVRDDKKREATDGFDGTWVAHPDLVETAMSEFDRALGKKPNQLDRQRPDVDVAAEQLLDVRIPGGTITEAGLRTNVSVGIQYIASWLRGTGAAAINNLMEDAATAEISRSQVWQWIHHAVSLAEGPRVTAGLVRDIEREELEKIKSAVGDDAFSKGRYDEARAIFDEVALSSEFKEFLTIPAYEHID